MTLPPPSDGHTVVVTGASSGIGAELARELSRCGHHITLVARRGDLLDQLRTELGNADAMPTDLTNDRARAELIDTLLHSERTVAGLCNNAGYGTSGPFAGLPLDTETAEVRLNVEAVHELTGAIVPGMVERHAGAILNVASIAGFQPLPGMATYSATKAFVITFSEALAAELHGTGVSCTVLCPGPTKTGFSTIAGVGDIESIFGRTFADPAKVAQTGVEAMVSGRRMVIPRRRDRVLVTAGRATPRGLQLAAVRLVTLNRKRT
jgi:short-subunit dehydrogenase